MAAQQPGAIPLLQPSLFSGETPLSDSRLVYKRIPEPLLAKFEEHGIYYHRHLRGPRRNIITCVLSFGNSQPIPFADLDRVNDAIDNATVRFRWRWGDLLLVDNFLMAHGRMSFRGLRRILVAIHRLGRPTDRIRRALGPRTHSRHFQSDSTLFTDHRSPSTIPQHCIPC